MTTESPAADASESAAPAAPDDASPKDRVIIFDTTMRDGEQSPGASMSLEEKLELAKILEDMKVDVIEAGFPIASNGDFESVRQVAAIVTESIVCGLARANPADIERAAEAIRGAKRGRIHTFISTSPSHRNHILRMSPEEVIDAVTGSVTLARNLCGDVEWSAQDASRTERDVLLRCVEAAIRAGAQTINLPDTVGYTYPSEYAEMFRDMIENVPGADGVVFSTHCHNDLGLAVANSLAGVEAGARQVECTINGLGERAGNAALEEVVMALRVRGDRLPFQTDVVSQQITRASRYVSAITASSSDSVPDCSPMPLMVDSTWRAPARIAARVFATPRPRSLWLCVDQMIFSAPGTRSRSMVKMRVMSAGRA